MPDPVVAVAVATAASLTDEAVVVQTTMPDDARLLEGTVLTVVDLLPEATTKEHLLLEATTNEHLPRCLEEAMTNEVTVDEIDHLRRGGGTMSTGLDLDQDGTTLTNVEATTGGKT